MYTWKVPGKFTVRMPDYPSLTDYDRYIEQAYLENVYSKIQLFEIRELFIMEHKIEIDWRTKKETLYGRKLIEIEKVIIEAAEKAGALPPRIVITDMEALEKELSEDKNKVIIAAPEAIKMALNDVKPNKDKKKTNKKKK